MKYLLISLLTALFLHQAFLPVANAQNDGSLNDRVKTSTSLSTPQGAFEAIGPVLSLVFTLAIIGGAIAAFIFFIIGAYQYISAQGGDGAVQGRQRMLWAAIGVIMLAAVYIVIIFFNSILPTQPSGPGSGACPAGQVDVGGGNCSG